MKRFLILFAPFIIPGPALAIEWTSLISTDFFDGIHADILLVVAGLIGIALVICGAGLLIGAMRR